MVDRTRTREVHHVGVTQGKKNALEELAALRRGDVVGNRTQQLKEQTERGIFEEIDESEYKLIDKERRKDFIVDDDFGYADGGGEIWEGGVEEPKRKKMKMETQREKGTYGDLSSMLVPSGARGSERASRGRKVGVSEKESEDLMNNLFAQMDESVANNPSLTGSHEIDYTFPTAPYLGTGTGAPIAFNTEDMYKGKYALIPKRKEEPEPEIKQEVKQEVKEEVKQEEVKEIPRDVKDTTLNSSDIRSKSMGPQGDLGAKRSREEFVQGQKDHELKTEALKSDVGKVPPMSANNTQRSGISSMNIPPMHKEEDGSTLFYLLDAHEDYFNYPGEIYLFGKVLAKVSEQGKTIDRYLSCCIVVKNLEREMFVLPMDSHEDKIMEVYSELEKLRQHRFPKIKEWGCKPVFRNYAFEMPLERGKHQFLKIKYKALYPPLPDNLSGQTFKHIFGKKRSMLELFLIKRKIMGPCWLKINNPVVLRNNQVSWCKYEIHTSNKKDITTTNDQEKRGVPPLLTLSISMKNHRGKNKINQVCAISCILSEIELGMGTPRILVKFTLLRKIESLPVPIDFGAVLKHSNPNSLIISTENGLLDELVNRIYQMDPDIYIGHDLWGNTMDFLLGRINILKIPHPTRLGRLKRGGAPSGKASPMIVVRGGTIGRILVDMFLVSKELVRETTYTLSYLAQRLLGKERKEFEEEMVEMCYKSSATLIQFIAHGENDADLSSQLMHKLSALPLTKQLTNIAGNLWWRSLVNARAERNEMLLLHEFHTLKYVCPDKAQGGRQEEGEYVKQDKKRKKAQYAGGLVLEPKAGFYDKLIMLLDFNSLYPSIIQEYNLCFTTVTRRPTQSFMGSGGRGQETRVNIERENADPTTESKTTTEIELVDPPNPDLKQGLLPNILRNLVEKRRAVKKLMKNIPVSNPQYEQYDIRQKALKLTANSMYGCLGFGNSRFYAGAIAALITSLGRDILQKTVDLTQNMNLEVVYGDTDSIMINSNTTNLSEAIKAANQVKYAVNKIYKCLEIEIDGVFKTLLLLRKKKYAAIKLNDINDMKKGESKEIKGLDMVRRDWCPLSKRIGSFVLDEILSGKNREDIIEIMYSKMTEIGAEIRGNKLELQEYIITKQLTKSPEQYKDKAVQPHVQVALGLKKKGIREQLLVNHFIPYVICLPIENNSSNTNPRHHQLQGERAHHPDDVIGDEELQVDFDWYIHQQVIPPIARLIEYMDGIDIKSLAQCLGVDPSKFKLHHGPNIKHEQEDYIDNLIINKDEGYKNNTLKEFEILCPFCRIQYDFLGVLHDDDETSGIFCVGCKKELPMAYLKNRLRKDIHDILREYFQGWFICSEPYCKYRTKMAPEDRKCIVPRCTGKLSLVVSDKKINDTLFYYKSLFDYKEAEVKLKSKDKNKTFDLSTEHKMKFDKLMGELEALIQKCGYTKVNLTNLFGFMGNW